MGPVLPPTNISEPRTYYNLNSCSGEGDRGAGDSRCACCRTDRHHPYEVLEIVENAKNENRNNCNQKLYQNSDVINVELKNGRSHLRYERSHAPCSELRLDVNMQNGNWSSLDFNDPRSSMVASQPRSCSSLVASQHRCCSTLVAVCQPRTSLVATQPHSLMAVIQPSASLVATLPRSSLVANEPRPSPVASESHCCNIDGVSIQNQLLKGVQESQVIIRMSPSPSPPVSYQNIGGVKKVFNYDEDVTDSYSRVTQFSSDHERLSLVYRRLAECVFYRGPLSSADAKVILKPFPVGTFLLRDSSDSGHLFFHQRPDQTRTDLRPDRLRSRSVLSRLRSGPAPSDDHRRLHNPADPGSRDAAPCHLAAREGQAE